MERLTSEEVEQFTSLLNARANIVRKILSEFSSASSSDIQDHEHELARIQVRMNCHQRTFKEGDRIELDIELENAGKTAAELKCIEEAIPPKLELLEDYRGFDTAERVLDLKGTILEPSKTRSIKLVLRGTKQGLFTLAPCIIYSDNQGDRRALEPEPTEILVSTIMRFLVDCFGVDYAQNRLPFEEAGWRTLMDIVNSQHISRSQVYGDGRRGRTFGRQLQNLVEEGLVEMRIFPGERGRGGRIVKVRVNCQKERARKLLKLSPISTLHELSAA